MLIFLLCDLIIALIFIVGSYYGYTRGLFRITARAARLIVCFAFSFGLTPLLSKVIVYPLVSRSIAGYISTYIEGKYSDFVGGVDNFPTVMRIVTVIWGHSSADGSVEIGETVSSLCTHLVSFISTALTFILLMFFSKMLFNLIAGFIAGIMDIGVLGIVNRCLGVMLSCFFAFILSWLFATAVDFALSSSYVAERQGIELQQVGPLFAFFRRINPIVLLLSF